MLVHVAACVAEISLDSEHGTRVRAGECATYDPQIDMGW